MQLSPCLFGGPPWQPQLRDTETGSQPLHSISLIIRLYPAAFHTLLLQVSLDSRQLQRLDLSHCTALQRLHLPALHQQRQQLQAQMNADAVGASAAQVLIGPLDGAAALLPQVRAAPREGASLDLDPEFWAAKEDL